MQRDSAHNVGGLRPYRLRSFTPKKKYRRLTRLITEYRAVELVLCTCYLCASNSFCSMPSTSTDSRCHCRLARCCSRRRTWRYSLSDNPDGPGLASMLTREAEQWQNVFNHASCECEVRRDSPLHSAWQPWRSTQHTPLIFIFFFWITSIAGFQNRTAHAMLAQWPRAAKVKEQISFGHTHMCILQGCR